MSAKTLELSFRFPQYYAYDIVVNATIFAENKQKYLTGRQKVRINDICWRDFTDSAEYIRLISGNDFIAVYNFLIGKAASAKIDSQEYVKYKSFYETAENMLNYYVIKYDMPECFEEKHTYDEAEIEKRLTKFKVGITFQFSMDIFDDIYPGLKLIKNMSDLEGLNLVIVPGGEDISPALYNQGNKGIAEVNSERDRIEVPIVRAAINLKKNIYGVCRGHQLINAIHGCDYFQDIFSCGYDPHPAYHLLETQYGEHSIIEKFFRKKYVVSTHHQGLTNSYLRETSSYRGVTESTEQTNIITTQFHPEFQEGNEDFFTYLKYWSCGLGRYYLDNLYTASKQKEEYNAW